MNKKLKMIINLMLLVCFFSVIARSITINNYDAAVAWSIALAWFLLFRVSDYMNKVIVSNLKTCLAVQDEVISSFKDIIKSLNSEVEMMASSRSEYLINASKKKSETRSKFNGDDRVFN